MRLPSLESQFRDSITSASASSCDVVLKNFNAYFYVKQAAEVS